MTTEWAGIVKAYVRERCTDVEDVCFWGDFVTAFSSVDNFTIRIDGPQEPRTKDAALAITKLIIDEWVRNYPNRLKAAVLAQK